jgi:nitrile hydratase
MDGIHDLGGKQGFGLIPYRLSEPKFHHRWEQRVFALVELLIGNGYFNVDRFRHAVERVPPTAYLTSGYYGRWFAAIEILLEESGAIAPRELELGAATPVEDWSARVRDLRAAARPPSSPRRQLAQPPRFELGERVRTRRLIRSGHCRLPAYARGREGTVVEVHPAYVYPDCNAGGSGEHPQYVYSVMFAAHELWGEEAEAETAVSLDLFEPYLEGSGPDPASAQASADPPREQEPR